jgi:hypothetical protein
MDLNHGSTGYEPVGISGRPGFPDVFLTTLPRCGAAMEGSVYELRPRRRRAALGDPASGATRALPPRRIERRPPPIYPRLTNEFRCPWERSRSLSLERTSSARRGRVAPMNCCSSSRQRNVPASARFGSAGITFIPEGSTPLLRYFSPPPASGPPRSDSACSHGSFRTSARSSSSRRRAAGRAPPRTPRPGRPPDSGRYAVRPAHRGPVLRLRPVSCRLTGIGRNGPLEHRTMNGLVPDGGEDPPTGAWPSS